MNRFTFRLRAVSVLRNHREAKARESLVVAQGSLVRAEARLADVRLRLAEMAALSAAGRSHRFRADQEVAFYLAYQRECVVEQQARKEVTQALAEVERRRQVCVEANRELKAIEKLEVRQLERYRAGVARAEQSEFDEFSNRRTAANASLTS